MIKLLEPFSIKTQLHINQGLLQELWDKYVPVSSESYERISLIYPDTAPGPGEMPRRQLGIWIRLILKNIHIWMNIQRQQTMVNQKALTDSVRSTVRYYMEQIKRADFQTFRQLDTFVTYLDHAAEEDRRYESWQREDHVIRQLQQECRALERFTFQVRDLLSVGSRDIEKTLLKELFSSLGKKEYKVLSEAFIWHEKEQVKEYIRHCSTQQYYNALDRLVKEKAFRTLLPKKAYKKPPATETKADPAEIIYTQIRQENAVNIHPAKVLDALPATGQDTDTAADMQLLLKKENSAKGRQNTVLRNPQTGKQNAVQQNTVLRNPQAVQPKAVQATWETVQPKADLGNQKAVHQDPVEGTPENAVLGNPQAVQPKAVQETKGTVQQKFVLGNQKAVHQDPVEGTPENVILGNPQAVRQKAVSGYPETIQQKAVQDNRETVQQKNIQGNPETIQPKAVQDNRETVQQKSIQGNPEALQEKSIQGPQGTVQNIVLGNSETLQEKSMQGPQETIQQNIVFGNPEALQEKSIQGPQGTVQNIVLGNSETLQEKSMQGPQETIRQNIVLGNPEASQQKNVQETQETIQQNVIQETSAVSLQGAVQGTLETGVDGGLQASVEEAGTAGQAAGAGNKDSRTTGQALADSSREYFIQALDRLTPKELRKLYQKVIFAGKQPYQDEADFFRAGIIWKTTRADMVNLVSRMDRGQVQHFWKKIDTFSKDVCKALEQNKTMDMGAGHKKKKRSYHQVCIRFSAKLLKTQEKYLVHIVEIFQRRVMDTLIQETKGEFLAEGAISTAQGIPADTETSAYMLHILPNRNAGISDHPDTGIYQTMHAGILRSSNASDSQEPDAPVSKMHAGEIRYNPETVIAGILLPVIQRNPDSLTGKVLTAGLRQRKRQKADGFFHILSHICQTVEEGIQEQKSRIGQIELRNLERYEDIVPISHLYRKLQPQKSDEAQQTGGILRGQQQTGEFYHKLPEWSEALRFLLQAENMGTVETDDRQGGTPPAAHDPEEISDLSVGMRPPEHRAALYEDNDSPEYRQALSTDGSSTKDITAVSAAIRDQQLEAGKPADFVHKDMQSVIRQQIAASRDKASLKELVEQINHYVREEEFQIVYRESQLEKPAIRQLLVHIQKMDRGQYRTFARNLADMIIQARRRAFLDEIQETADRQEPGEADVYRVYEEYPAYVRMIHNYETQRFKIREALADMLVPVSGVARDVKGRLHPAAGRALQQLGNINIQPTAGRVIEQPGNNTMHPAAERDLRQPGDSIMYPPAGDLRQPGDSIVHPPAGDLRQPGDSIVHPPAGVLQQSGNRIMRSAAGGVAEQPGDHAVQEAGNSMYPVGDGEDAVQLTGISVYPAESNAAGLPGDGMYPAKTNMVHPAENFPITGNPALREADQQLAKRLQQAGNSARQLAKSIRLIGESVFQSADDSIQPVENSAMQPEGSGVIRQAGSNAIGLQPTGNGVIRQAGGNAIGLQPTGNGVVRQAGGNAIELQPAGNQSYQTERAGYLQPVYWQTQGQGEAYSLQHAVPKDISQDTAQAIKLRMQEETRQVKAIQEELQAKMADMEKQLKQEQRKNNAPENVREVTEQVKQRLYEELHVERLRRGLS